MVSEEQSYNRAKDNVTDDGNHNVHRGCLNGPTRTLAFRGKPRRWQVEFLADFHQIRFEFFDCLRLIVHATARNLDVRPALSHFLGRKLRMLLCRKHQDITHHLETLSPKSKIRC